MWGLNKISYIKNNYSLVHKKGSVNIPIMIVINFLCIWIVEIKVIGRAQKKGQIGPSEAHRQCGIIAWSHKPHHVLEMSTSGLSAESLKWEFYTT